MKLTDYHAKYFAHELTRRRAPDSVEKLAGAVASAQVDLNPHQVDAALFTFNSPLSKNRPGIPGDSILSRNGVMKSSTRYSPEVREWAIRLVLEHQGGVEAGISSPTGRVDRGGLTQTNASPETPGRFILDLPVIPTTTFGNKK